MFVDEVLELTVVAEENGRRDRDPIGHEKQCECRHDDDDRANPKLRIECETAGSDNADGGCRECKRRQRLPGCWSTSTVR